jgi:DNA-binding response OmpR family regulator
VVVIEDEASIASAVATRLRNEGFTVEVVGDGPAGVALCGEVRPDLVILDLMLLGLDERRRRARAGSGPPAAPARP